MPASTHSALGSVQAIQYTGTNAADLQATLGTGFCVYTNTVNSTIALCQTNRESLGLNQNILHATDWLVSLPAYGGQAPALTGGFSVLTDAQFTQQFSV